MTAAQLSTVWTTETQPDTLLALLDINKFSTARLPVVVAGFTERGRLVELLSPDQRQLLLDYARWVFGFHPRPLPIPLPVFDRLVALAPDRYDADDRLRDVMGNPAAGWLNIGMLMRAEAAGARRGSVLAPLTRPDADEWQRRQADALRDALGNPFRPVTWEPSWRSETAVALARGIHFDNAFDRLPILADALEEAGCDHPGILKHCRGTGPHARGCWVVDGVMGKV